MGAQACASTGARGASACNVVAEACASTGVRGASASKVGAQACARTGVRRASARKALAQACATPHQRRESKDCANQTTQQNTRQHCYSHQAARCRLGPEALPRLQRSARSSTMGSRRVRRRRWSLARVSRSMLKMPQAARLTPFEHSRGWGTVNSSSPDSPRGPGA